MITPDSILNIFSTIKSLSLFDLHIERYLYFLVTLTFFFLVRNFLNELISKKILYLFRFRNINQSTKKNLDGPIKLFIVGIGLSVASYFLSDSEKIYEFLHKINSSIFTIIIFWFLSQIIRPSFLKIKNVETILTRDLVEWITNFIRIVIFILGFCAVLELWGIRVGPIVAGLGLFGVAVALGAQDLFKNLISGVLVLIEKRFKKGDVVLIENIIEGVVEKIGFRSTAIRKFDKSLCYIPNNQFAENAVTNITKISNRRINWIIGLEYKSSTKQLKSICKDIEKKITSNKNDFCVNEITPVIVKINEFSASSIDILVRCFTNNNDFQEFLNVKDRLALDIKEIVERRGCSFAFPSQSLYIEKS
jgi:MscS family membrane protein